MINSLLRHFGFFDLNGLKYSMEELRRARNLIPTWSRDKQAEYVDAETKRICTNSWNRRNISMSEFNQVIDLINGLQILPDNWFLDPDINTTTIGNLAYVSLNLNSVYARKAADDALTQYSKYFWLNYKQ